MNALSAGRPRASKHSCSRSRLSLGRFSPAPFQQVNPAELPPEGTREYPSSALFGAPPVHGRGRQSPDQARDMAAELVGWT